MKCATVAWFLVLISLVLFERIVPETKVEPKGWVTRFQRPALLSHRGSRYMCPENTIQCFTVAKQLGADVLETDARLTKDGVLVALHDEHCGRCAGRPDVAVEQSTFAELQMLDMAFQLSPDNATFPFRDKGFKVNTFDQILTEFHTENINIEIKEDDPKVVDSLAAVLSRYPAEMQNRIMIASRWCPVTYYTRTQHPNWATAACEGEVVAAVVLTKSWLIAPYFTLWPPQYQALQIPTVTGGVDVLFPRLLQVANRWGIKTHFWVLNTREKMEETLSLGADGFFTDRTDVASGVFARHPRTRKWYDKPRKTKVVLGEDWFVPRSSGGEVHDCVTLSCQLLSVVDPGHMVLLGLFFLFWGLESIVRLCLPSRPRRPARGESASGAKQA